MPELPKQPPKERILNCFAFGLAEHGRLGIGPPDDARMIRESGCVIGWHKSPHHEDRPDVKVTNTRAVRSHQPGLLRLAKLPAGMPEAAVGGTGGVVLPRPVERPIRANGPRVVCVDTGESHSLCLTHDGKVFGWGNGSEGQLGCEVIKQGARLADIQKLAKQTKITGVEQKVSVSYATQWPNLSVHAPSAQATLPRKVEKTEFGEEEAPVDPVKSVHCSAKASFVLTESGRVWCWGSGKFNVLGQTATQGKQPSDENGKEETGSRGGGGGGESRKEKGKKHEEEVSVGEEEEVAEAVRKQKKFDLAWGVSMEEFGCGDSSFPLLVRGPVERQTVVELSCGYYHVLALTLARKVLAWGRNQHGQLGIGRVTPFETPRQVKLSGSKEPVLSVAAGESHSLAVVQVTRPDGRVDKTAFAWGCKDNGRLGGVNDKRTFQPQEVTSLMAVYKKYHLKGFLRKVCCGRAHSLALTSDERVISWGAGSYGQLGNGFGFDAEQPQMVAGCYSVVQLSAGARHTLALCGFAPRNCNTPKDDDDDDDHSMASLEKKKEASAKEEEEGGNGGGGGGGSMDQRWLYEPFGKDDPTKAPPVFLANDDREPTDKIMNQRANELYAWGWNGFGELGTGDELPRLSPARVTSVLPASAMMVAAGDHHSLVLTTGFGVACREDNQRPFLGYGPFVKRMEGIYEKEAEADFNRMLAMSVADDDEASEEGGGGGEVAASMMEAAKTDSMKGGLTRPKLSATGELKLRLLSAPLRKEMEYARLDPWYLDRPDALVPDQIGLPEPTANSTSPKGGADDGTAAAGGENVNDDDEGSVNTLSTASTSKKKPTHAGPKPKLPPGELPRFARKWHAQEAVAPRDFSLGAYCLDTPFPGADKDRFPPLRGSYAAVYECKICRLSRVCVICARHCHASHAVTVHLKRSTDVGGPCDCGCPPPPALPLKPDKIKGAKVWGGASAERQAKSKAKSAARAAEQGRVLYVNKCRCQGTLERRVFDKHLDPLDGKVRVRQLEALLREMHYEQQHASGGSAEEGEQTGKKPAVKATEFDYQDARDAEEHLGVIVNGAPPDEDVETVLVPWDPTAGEGGIDFPTFSAWKERHEEQKRERMSLGVADDDSDSDRDANS